MSQDITNPLLKQIEQQLGKDGVWISPQLKGQVSPAQEKQIEVAVAKAPTPTYVVLVDLSDNDPLTQGETDNFANILRQDTGHDGHYIVLTRWTDGTPVLQVQTFPDDYVSYQAAEAAKIEQPTNLSAQTLDLLSILRGGSYDARLAQAKAKHRATYQTYYGAPSGSSAHGGGHGAAIGISIGSVVIVLGLLATLVRAAVKRHAPSKHSRAATPPTFTLPKAVLTTVREAEDRQHEHQAQSEVLALGETIDKADLTATTPAAQAAWQAALDHYDAADQILDHDHSPADAIGALVLARRGSAALAAATAGRAWAPAPGCYFNPLHPTPSGEVTWKNGSRRVEVPACDRCATAVRAGREPEDVLDFVSDGTPRHYFNLKLGVWSATGYGALDTDLLGRLVAP